MQKHRHSGFPMRLGLRALALSLAVLTAAGGGALGNVVHADCTFMRLPGDRLNRSVALEDCPLEDENGRRATSSAYSPRLFDPEGRFAREPATASAQGSGVSDLIREYLDGLFSVSALEDGAAGGSNAFGLHEGALPRIGRFEMQSGIVTDSWFKSRQAGGVYRLFVDSPQAEEEDAEKEKADEEEMEETEPVTRFDGFHRPLPRFYTSQFGSMEEETEAEGRKGEARESDTEGRILRAGELLGSPFSVPLAERSIISQQLDGSPFDLRPRSAEGPTGLTSSRFMNAPPSGVPSTFSLTDAGRWLRGSTLDTLIGDSLSFLQRLFDF